MGSDDNEFLSGKGSTLKELLDSNPAARTWLEAAAECNRLRRHTSELEAGLEMATEENAELRAENARLMAENAINKPCVVALEECEAKLKDAVDACISDAVEIGRLKAENARLREGCEHSLIALDGRMPELARRIRDALEGKGT